jgi:hypothetical protein
MDGKFGEAREKYKLHTRAHQQTTKSTQNQINALKMGGV